MKFNFHWLTHALHRAHSAAGPQAFEPSFPQPRPLNHNLGTKVKTKMIRRNYSIAPAHRPI